MKQFFNSVVAWLVVPAMVIYGYLYGNVTSVYLVLFYIWIIFALQVFVSICLIIVLVLADDDWIVDSDTLKNKKKIKAILKWNDKLKSSWYKLTTSASTILYLGLAVVIAASGAVGAAFLFTLTFVVFKYIFLETVKSLYERLSPQIKKAAEKLQMDEILDMVGKGESK